MEYKQFTIDMDQFRNRFSNLYSEKNFYSRPNTTFEELMVTDPTEEFLKELKALIIKHKGKEI